MSRGEGMDATIEIRRIEGTSMGGRFVAQLLESDWRRGGEGGCIILAGVIIYFFRNWFGGRGSYRIMGSGCEDVSAGSRSVKCPL